MLWGIEPEVCGFMDTDWEYKNGKYYTNYARYGYYRCSHKYSIDVPTDQARANLSEEDWWRHRYQKEIRKIIDPLVRQFAIDECHERKYRDGLKCHK